MPRNRNLHSQDRSRSLAIATLTAVAVLMLSAEQGECVAKTSTGKPSDSDRTTALLNQLRKGLPPRSSDSSMAKPPTAKNPALRAAKPPVLNTVKTSNLSEAEKSFQQLKKSGFKGNPSIELLERLAGEMHNQGRWADKELVMRAILASHEKEYGANHPMLANQLEPIIELNRKQGKSLEASKLQERMAQLLKNGRETIDATPQYDVHADGTTTERSPMSYTERLADLRRRADIYSNHADFATSAAYLKKALTESKEEDNGGGFNSEDYKNLADCEEKLGHDKEAQAFRGQAESVLR